MPDNQGVDISLVICTRNRAEALSRCLEAVAAMDTAGIDWELIVVDNGSTDTTAAVLSAVAPTFRQRMHVVEQPMRGLDRARNAGIRAARGAIITLTDDDCYPEPGFLRAVHRCFEEDGGLDFLAGRIRLFDPTDLPLTIYDEPNRREILPYTFVHAYLTQGANLSFRRSLADRLGGFDPRLDAGAPFKASGDTDFVARAVWSGHRGAYDPRPVVFHHHGRKDERVERAVMHAYAVGAGAHLAKRLLDRSSRRVYARAWLEQTWDDFRVEKSLRRVSTEIFAAVRYICTAAFRARPSLNDQRAP